MCAEGDDVAGDGGGLESMLLNLFALLLNWELVALHDFDGEINIRRVIYFGKFRYAWRWPHVGLIQLLPEGKTRGRAYVTSWETVKARRRFV